jgi:cell division protein FtsL
VAIGALIVVVICAVTLSVRQHYARAPSQPSDSAYLKKAMKDQEKMGWAHQ